MTNHTIASGTAEGLIEFLDTLVKKGRATQGAITPIRTAVIKVLEAVDGPSWKTSSVDSIDIDEYMQRFANLTKGTYTPKSVSVYKSQLTRAVGWYLKFMSPSDAGWMPIITPRAPRKSSTPQPVQGEVEKPVSSGQQVEILPPEVLHPRAVTATNLINYPFPLRDGQVATLSLPSPMHRSDAERIARFVETLVINTETTQKESDDEGIEA
jgi:hypothetical protein